MTSSSFKGAPLPLQVHTNTSSPSTGSSTVSKNRSPSQLSQLSAPNHDTNIPTNLHCNPNCEASFMASPCRGSPTAATVFLSGLQLSNRFHTHFLLETAQTRENKRARVTLTTTTTATNERLILIHPGWWPFIRVPAPGTEASWTAGLDDRWAQGTPREDEVVMGWAELVL